MRLRVATPATTQVAGLYQHQRFVGGKLEGNFEATLVVQAPSTVSVAFAVGVCGRDPGGSCCGCFHAPVRPMERRVLPDGSATGAQDITGAELAGGVAVATVPSWLSWQIPRYAFYNN